MHRCAGNRKCSTWAWHKNAASVGALTARRMKRCTWDVLQLDCIRLKVGCQVNESNFAIVLDVMAREIDMLRYQLKVKEEENAKLRAMIGEGREKHE